jgi:putative endopeptidase
MKTPYYLLIIVLFLNACTSKESSNPYALDPLPGNMDTTMTPSENFFLYANNTWFKNNPIQSSKSSNGIFQMVNDSVNKAVRAICEQSAANKTATKGSAEQKIGDFYASGMDTLAIEKNSLADIIPVLDRINAITDNKALMDVMAKLTLLDVAPLFSIYVSMDDKISSKYAVFLNQGGLGLPERDYYLLNDADNQSIRKAYIEHNKKMLVLLGVEEKLAEKQSNAVLEFETSLAKSSRTLEQLRDVYANYNKKSLSELQKLTPSIDWSIYSKAIGLNNMDSAIVGQPEFFKHINTLIGKTSLDIWKSYLTLQFINSYAPYLSHSFEQQHFSFYEQNLSGVQEQKPRWERVVEQTNVSLGEQIGQIYVRDYLPAGTKDKMIEIGKNISAVYREHITKLDWMSDSTKQKALAKLDKVNMKLGWPDKWRDYSALSVARTSYIKNVMNANVFEVNYMMSKYGKPVDRTEWHMTPQTYNAYYNPTSNEIVIPGCNIIVPGFKGLPDDAVLYAIVGGSTFGHEITHGFDDQGRLYDGNGNLKNWWSIEDSIQFTNKAQMLAQQFNQYTVNDSLHVRGEATLGENIADLGGVIMGYEAFKKTKQYTENQIINGLSPDQRFFQGYALAWMVQMTPKKSAMRIMTDVHAPPMYRVIGPLYNMDAFYKTYSITETSPFFRKPDSRISIW